MSIISLQVSPEIQVLYDEYVELLKASFPPGSDPGSLDDVLQRTHDIILGETLKAAIRLYKKNFPEVK